MEQKEKSTFGKKICCVLGFNILFVIMITGSLWGMLLKSNWTHEWDKKIMALVILSGICVVLKNIAVVPIYLCVRSSSKFTVLDVFYQYGKAGILQAICFVVCVCVLLFCGIIEPFLIFFVLIYAIDIGVTVRFKCRKALCVVVFFIVNFLLLLVIKPLVNELFDVLFYELLQPIGCTIYYPI